LGDELKILLERPFIFAALACACLLAALDRYGCFEPAPLPRYAAARSITPRRIAAVVAGNPEQKNGKLQFKTLVTSIDNKPVSFKALAVYRDQYFDLLPLDSVELEGNISPIKKTRNPGAFDYPGFMARKGINSVIYPSSMTLVKISGRWLSA
jgi:hypothetical protein